MPAPTGSMRELEFDFERWEMPTQPFKRFLDIGDLFKQFVFNWRRFCYIRELQDMIVYFLLSKMFKTYFCTVTGGYWPFPTNVYWMDQVLQGIFHWRLSCRKSLVTPWVRKLSSLFKLDFFPFLSHKQFLYRFPTC